MTKAKAIEAINHLPQDYELDPLIEELIFIDKEKGLAQLDNKNTLSHKQVKQRVKKHR